MFILITTIVLISLLCVGVVAWGVDSKLQALKRTPENMILGWGTRPIPKRIVLEDLYQRFPTDLLILVTIMEDDRFWNHRGFNVPELLRSIQHSLRHRTLKGGSSITQQVGKRILSHTSRKPKSNYQRFLKKILESIVTPLIEYRLSKEEIISLYLESVPYTDGIYGVEGASRAFFSKEAINLSAHESFILIYMISHPMSSSRRILNPARANEDKINFRLAYEKLLILTRINNHYYPSKIPSIQEINFANFIMPSTDRLFEEQCIRKTSKIVYDLPKAFAAIQHAFSGPPPFLHSYLNAQMRAALHLFTQSMHIKYTDDLVALDLQIANKISEIGLYHDIIQLFPVPSVVPVEAQVLHEHAEKQRQSICETNRSRQQYFQDIVTCLIQADPNLRIGGDQFLASHCYGENQRRLEQIIVIPSPEKQGAILKLLNANGYSKGVIVSPAKTVYTELASRLQIVYIDHNWLYDWEGPGQCTYVTCPWQPQTCYKSISPIGEFHIRVLRQEPYAPRRLRELEDLKRLISVGDINIAHFFMNDCSTQHSKNIQLAITMIHLLLGVGIPSEEFAFKLVAFMKRYDRDISASMKTLIAD